MSAQVSLMLVRHATESLSADSFLRLVLDEPGFNTVGTVLAAVCWLLPNAPECWNWGPRRRRLLRHSRCARYWRRCRSWAHNLCLESDRPDGQTDHTSAESRTGPVWWCQCRGRRREDRRERREFKEHPEVTWCTNGMILERHRIAKHLSAGAWDELCEVWHATKTCAHACVWWGVICRCTRIPKQTKCQQTNGPRPTHSGTEGGSEPCVQREPTRRAILVIVIEQRK